MQNIYTASTEQICEQLGDELAHDLFSRLDMDLVPGCQLIGEIIICDSIGSMELAKLDIDTTLLDFYKLFKKDQLIAKFKEDYPHLAF